MPLTTILVLGFRQPPRIGASVDGRVTVLIEPLALDTLTVESESLLVILGPQLSASLIADIMRRTLEWKLHVVTRVIVLHGKSKMLLQEVPDDQPFYFIAPGDLQMHYLDALIDSVNGDEHRKQLPTLRIGQLAQEDQDFIERVRQSLLTRGRLVEAVSVIVEALESLIPDSHVEVWLNDEQRDTLFTFRTDSSAELRLQRTSGFGGYVSRVNCGVYLTNASLESWTAGKPSSESNMSATSLIGEPLFDSADQMIGILIVESRGSRSTTHPRYPTIVQVFAKAVANILSVLVMRHKMEVRLRSQTRMKTATEDFYGEEALAAYPDDPEVELEPLRFLPRWLTVSHWLVLSAVLGGLAFLLIGRTNQRVSGPFLIQARTSVPLSAKTSGLVSTFFVRPGDQVQAGSLMLRLQSSAGDDYLTRLKQESRAPTSGIVRDIRVRVGEEVREGDQLATIVPSASLEELVALLPGSTAPQLKVGQTLVVRLSGYPDVADRMQIYFIATQVIGPQEAAYFLGRQSVGSFVLSGPMILVRCRLTHPSFLSEERWYSYRDGMTGQAEAILRSEPLIFELLPGLRNVASKLREELISR